MNQNSAHGYTDNEVIAKFMGFAQAPSENCYKCPDGFNPYQSNIIYKDSVKYDTSWDWLMPVVEKIERLKYFVNLYSSINENGNVYSTCVFNDNGEEIVGFEKWGKDRLKITYKAVVAFIKWHNNQQSK